MMAQAMRLEAAVAVTRFFRTSSCHSRKSLGHPISTIRTVSVRGLDKRSKEHMQVKSAPCMPCSLGSCHLDHRIGTGIAPSEAPAQPSQVFFQTTSNAMMCYVLARGCLQQNQVVTNTEGFLHLNVCVRRL